MSVSASHPPKRSRIRRLALAVAAVLLAAVTFGLGAVVGARQGWLQPLVSVAIQNHTGQALAGLVLSYTSSSSSSSGTIALSPLAVGARTTARFYLAGEGTYSVKATLANGTVLTSQEGYVEPGYTATEVLLDSGAQGSVRYGATTR